MALYSRNVQAEAMRFVTIHQRQWSGKINFNLLLFEGAGGRTLRARDSRTNQLHLPDARAFYLRQALNATSPDFLVAHVFGGHKIYPKLSPSPLQKSLWGETPI
jgi:hypothetical protein